MDAEMRLIDYIKESKILKKRGTTGSNPLRIVKIAILRSFTCETLENILPVELYKAGLDCRLFIGGYNSFFQDTFDENGGLYGFKPDVLIYAIRIEDIIPEDIKESLIYGVWTDDLILGSDKRLAELAESLEKMLRFAQEKLGCPIIINSFAKPADAWSGLCQQAKNGINNIVRMLNLRLLNICAKHGAFTADAEDIISEIGRNTAYDSRMWEIAKNPYTFQFYVRLAKLYSRYIYVFFLPRKKCIALDLDNTLWSGIIGEQQNDNCNPYTEFQRELKRLRKTGILLAAVSKNNYEDVAEFFKEHDMPLKIEDFSALKINWKDKPDNILEIAAELNILPDSIVFIDDNPVEREYMKQSISGVFVLDFQNTKDLREKDFLQAVKGLYCLDYLKLTEEDENRAEMYRAQQFRAEYESTSGNLEAFLSGLEMKAEISLINKQNISRAAQLTQKTNQFNLTTKRYSENELQSIIRRGFHVYGLWMADKFGDYGMTGLMIIKPAGDCWEIDSFLLSCRIMSRKAEYMFMAEILRRARENNVKSIIASYVPTGKNKPVENLYDDMGFKKNGVYWKRMLDSAGSDLKAPEYITLIRG